MGVRERRRSRREGGGGIHTVAPTVVEVLEAAVGRHGRAARVSVQREEGGSDGGLRCYSSGSAAGGGGREGEKGHRRWRRPMRTVLSESVLARTKVLRALVHCHRVGRSRPPS